MQNMFNLKLVLGLVANFHFFSKNLVFEYWKATKILEKCIEGAQEVVFLSLERLLLREINQMSLQLWVLLSGAPSKVAIELKSHFSVFWRFWRFWPIFLTEKHSGSIHNVESSGTKLHVDFIPSATWIFLDSMKSLIMPKINSNSIIELAPLVK